MGKLRNRLGRATLALVCALVSSAASTSVPDATPYEPPMPPVQRCMNLSSALEAPYEGDWGYTIRNEDIDRLKEAGFDTIRLPVRWSAHAGRWGRYKLNKGLLARTDAIIDYAMSRDMNVILNVHHYSELNNWPWRHERRLEGIWKQLAAHYEDYPDRLIFEIVNEPNGKMTVQRTDALNKRVVARIRKTQPDRWIVLATAEWGSIAGLLQSQPPSDPRIILSWHYYEPFVFTHQGAEFFRPTPPIGTNWGDTADVDRIAKDFRLAAAFRDKHNLPLLLGEFGVFDAAPVEQRAKWIGSVRHLAEANGFGWCHWGLSSNFRSYDADKEAWIEPVRAALLDD
ncbi:glycoside hydrolase family 5 protein [Hyphomonas sp.]|uniref:glycoside hydrolase family 5 protein n=1 Tax=Hyphomonas sp. TaxID=87 RepID=UPI0030FAD18D